MPLGAALSGATHPRVGDEAVQTLDVFASGEITEREYQDRQELQESRRR
jgi:hypothetical protein